MDEAAARTGEAAPRASVAVPPRCGHPGRAAETVARRSPVQLHSTSPHGRWTGAASCDCWPESGNRLGEPPSDRLDRWAWSPLFHRFGVLCFGWDAQQPRVLNELLDMGIDAVYSDHVDRMRDALDKLVP